MVGVGTSYEVADPAFTDLVLPFIDFIEVIPDTLAIKQGKHPVISKETLNDLTEMATQATIIVHGVGLSIGSYNDWNENYFRLLDQILEVVPVAWHSEHLGFVNVEGQFVGTMLSLPRTQEAFDLVAERVRRLMDRYQLPFLLENIVNLFPDPPADMSEATFLNELALTSNCGLLLDIYNLECNAHNQGYQVADFLNEINLDLVREIHVAGGIERAGLMLDVHSRRTRQMTRQLLPDILKRASKVEAVIYELMPEAVPVVGHKAWADELSLLKTMVTI